MPIRMAIVGTGIGRVHIRTLHEEVGDAQIVAVCDLNLAAAKEHAATCQARAFDDYVAMLDQVKPDGVVLATPPKIHAEHTVLAAERGVHVLCEKPMAPNVGDCERMIEACAKANVTLMIAFKKRFYSCYRFIREKVQETGAPLLWGCVRFALGRVEKDWFWQEDDGGGPLLENAIHEYDILRFLMGEIKQAYAAGGNLFMTDRAPQIDAAGAVLTLANGGVVSMGIGYGSEWNIAKEELALASSKLAFELQGPFDSPNSLRYVDRDDPQDIQTVELSSYNRFKPELEHFLECIAGRATCKATGQDGLAAVRVALAVKRSIREGTPVEV